MNKKMLLGALLASVSLYGPAKGADAYQDPEQGLMESIRTGNLIGMHEAIVAMPDLAEMSHTVFGMHPPLEYVINNEDKFPGEKLAEALNMLIASGVEPSSKIERMVLDKKISPRRLGDLEPLLNEERVKTARRDMLEKWLASGPSQRK